MTGIDCDCHWKLYKKPETYLKINLETKTEKQAGIKTNDCWYHTGDDDDDNLFAVDQELCLL